MPKIWVDLDFTYDHRIIAYRLDDGVVDILKDGASSGPVGPQGQQGPPGPDKKLQVRQVERNIVTVPLNTVQNVPSRATCNSDEFVTGGGMAIFNPPDQGAELYPMRNLDRRTVGLR